MTLARRAALAVAVLALGVLADVGAAPAPPPIRKDFGERLAVRETEVVFGPDDDLRATEPANAFAVVEGGARRQVVRAERLKDEPWRIVVYVDPRLGSAASAHLAALALSRASEELAERGAVELALADPAPATFLPPTREPRLLAERFAALANEMARRPEEGEPTTATVRRQLDRLVAFLAARREVAPHAVIFLADGLDVPPEVLNALAGDRVDPARLPRLPNAGGAREYAQTAQALAAYGWVVLPMVFREPSGPEAEVRSGGVASPGDHGGVALSPGEIWRRLRGKHPRRPADPRLADYGAEPRYAVLRAMARMTGGSVVGSPTSLDSAVADLPWRWRLWFSNPAEVNGGMLPLEVDLVRTGRAMRGPQWMRSGVPAEVADARLDALLGADAKADREVTGDLGVEIVVERTAAGTTARARLAAAPKGEAVGGWRVSIATDEGLLRRETVARPEGGLTIAPPPAARRIAVVVEEVGGDRWGGAAADLPAAAPGPG